MNKITTLTEFVLQEEHRVPNATGRLTLLLNQIGEATKIIASHVKRSGLADIIGKSGKTNSYDEETQKLDEYSNALLIEMLTNSQQVALIGSEELEKSVKTNCPNAEYSVFMDPLDGSSNIDVNVSIGTIFSIYHHAKGDLQPGKQQVAAGYILYGSSVMFVYTSGNGVNGFTLDPAIGSFLLSHPNMKIPEEHKEYSFNEGKYNLVNDSVRAYLDAIKSEEKPYQQRYIGSMVADLHRILLKGGIFLHPADKKMPQGKLRLMYEVNPFSLIVQQAGGKAVSENRDPLDIVPSEFHQRVPIVIGSKKEVEKYLTFVK
ncbi:class 1 fructose-bisphosphatase [Candidatus Woesebacteria bacterium]|jgi:fructose-1,6-bisphosphatase I|nr:class 1 fructose-bisphosphatase [Candidatus Woesebacteria bacterium]MBP6883407.1 class 1 fructose-bisphosphatase [Candidatus Woesebacteria bacterium]